MRAVSAPGVFGGRRIVVLAVDFGARSWKPAQVRLGGFEPARSARPRSGPVEEGEKVAVLREESGGTGRFPPPLRLGGFEPPTGGLEGRCSSTELQAR